MTDKPTFTVIIPTYNRGAVICKAINSVLNQTYQNFELIIVDDGSCDNTQDVVAGIEDLRVRYIFQNNGGGSNARNTGIDAADGEYVAFLDSDDLFQPLHLENALPVLESDKNICIYSQIIVDRGDGITYLKPPRALRSNENISDYLLRDRGFVPTSTVIVPKKLARAIRYDEELTYGQDTDFAIRLFHAGVRFKLLQQPGAICNDKWNPKRISSKVNPEKRKTWLNRVRPMITSRAYWADMGWNVAKGYAQNGMILKGVSLYLMALVKGCYRPQMGFVIFLQIVLPAKIYRQVADVLARHGATP